VKKRSLARMTRFTELETRRGKQRRMNSGRKSEQKDGTQRTFIEGVWRSNGPSKKKKEKGCVKKNVIICQA